MKKTAKPKPFTPKPFEIVIKITSRWDGVVDSSYEVLHPNTPVAHAQLKNAAVTLLMRCGDVASDILTNLKADIKKVKK